MIQLVDQAHGEQRAGIDDLRRIGLGADRRIKLLCEPAAGSNVSENYIPCVAKEKAVDLKLFPDCPRDVKFHCKSLQYRGLRLRGWLGVLFRCCYRRYKISASARRLCVFCCGQRQTAGSISLPKRMRQFGASDGELVVFATASIWIDA